MFTSVVQADFDRLARLSPGGRDHNTHYHSFLLRHGPSPCVYALDIGCGTGVFSRRLALQARQVLAVDPLAADWPLDHFVRSRLCN